MRTLVRKNVRGGAEPFSEDRWVRAHPAHPPQFRPWTLSSTLLWFHSLINSNCPNWIISCNAILVGVQTQLLTGKNQTREKKGTKEWNPTRRGGKKVSPFSSFFYVASVNQFYFNLWAEFSKSPRWTSVKKRMKSADLLHFILLKSGWHPPGFTKFGPCSVKREI